MTSPRDRLRALDQATPYTSPWTVRTRLAVGLWAVVWWTLFRPSPKPFKRWRAFLLRRFGARISGRPYVAPSAVVKMPWNLTLSHHSCLGPRSEVYNLGPVALGPHCTVSQEAYLCAGTHDLTKPNLPLVVGPITVGARVFIGARAFVLPGVEIGEGAVVGACAVVTKDVRPWDVVAGNPARVVGRRVMDSSPAGSGFDSPP